MKTIYCKLIAYENNPLGYKTYVFKSLDEEQERYIKSKYIMCVQFPNWDQKQINLNDEGYLQYKEIKEGEDKWFDGKEFISYKYSNIQFIKFIIKPNINIPSKIVLD